LGSTRAMKASGLWNGSYEDHSDSHFGPVAPIAWRVHMLEISSTGRIPKRWTQKGQPHEPQRGMQRYGMLCNTVCELVFSIEHNNMAELRGSISPTWRRVRDRLVSVHSIVERT